MSKLTILTAIALSSNLLLTACSGGGSNSNAATVATDTNTDNSSSSNTTCSDAIEKGLTLGISALPPSTAATYQAAFCKYAQLLAPNGKTIGIYAQDEISNEQLLRARNILSFFLAPVAGATQGSDKSPVANAMANNGATLVLMNGSDDGNNPLPENVDGQPLYATELVVEGSTAYIDNDYENHRDAAFEEILHLVHDYGIGTSGPDAAPGGNATYQIAIDSARENAMANALWPTAGVDADTTNWIEELRQEGSLSQEYLASVIDSYYGYWGAWTEGTGGMWGIYAAKTRTDVQNMDPLGYALVEQFFNPTVTYLARIDSIFTGDLPLSFDAARPYTHKSQYLVNAQLTGSSNSNLTGNDHANRLAGNAGSNTLDGKAGNDTAVLQGNYADYTVDISGSEIILQDSVNDRDGVLTLLNIERLEFKDQTVIPPINN